MGFTAHQRQEENQVGEKGLACKVFQSYCMQRSSHHFISIHSTTQAASSSLEGVQPCFVATPQQPGRVGPLGHHAASCIADGAGSSK